MKFAIQGGLPDAILDEKMRGLVLDTCKNVRKQVEKLSAFTHITRDVLYRRNDVEALSDQALIIFCSLLECIDVARKEFGRMVISNVADELRIKKIFTESYREVKGIPFGHSFRFWGISKLIVTDITDELIRIYTDGAVSVYPEGENDSGMTVNEGERMSMVIPFDSTLEAKIPDSLDTLDLKICDFELKMGEAESYM